MDSVRFDNVIQELACKEIARIIKVDISEWPGNCYFIAHELLQHGIFSGQLCYGVYSGYVHEHSIFAGRSIIRHGWITDGNYIIDPTRWTIDGRQPYIYHGVKSAEYDLGASKLRGICRKPFEDIPHSDDYLVPVKLERVIRSITQQSLRYLSKEQVLWLANCEPELFGDKCKDFYDWLATRGLRAFVPIDYWNSIFPPKIIKPRKRAAKRVTNNNRQSSDAG